MSFRRTVFSRKRETTLPLGILALTETGQHASDKPKDDYTADRVFTDREGNTSIFASSIINADINSSGDVWIGADAVVEGNVNAEGDLIMEKNSKITGSARVGGSANFKDNAVILGEVSIQGSVYRGNNPPEHIFKHLRPAMRLKESGSTGELPDIADEVDALISNGRIQPGSAVIIQEKKPHLSYALIRRLSSEGMKCMIIGREPPERVQSVRFIRINEEDVIWLTTLVGRRCVNPTHLGSVQNALTKFIDSNRRGIVLIDGLEYLISNNGFDAVLRFINKIEDMIITTGTTVVVSVDPRTLDAQHLALIERGSETVYSDNSAEETGTVLSAEIEERLKEESVRRQQLEDRLDGYLSRIENAIVSVKSEANTAQESRLSRLTELEDAREIIKEEIKAVDEGMRDREAELMKAIDLRLRELAEPEGKQHALYELEQQLRENSSLLLKAVLLAERLSMEKVGSNDTGLKKIPQAEQGNSI
ncbi:MAG: DUF835 domain-containing protein [Thermoplasmata archaeon]|nr:DUF835 domain-containing protein [Candidatus Sysuiplasma acidicola]MBX8646084.1 DUF835 domain-containing protein [Candidatus Sysuiplasma acidicola]MDH2905240.1 DUF835 domain-containing protein [Methanomassiliicoccales archaeon]